MDTYQAAMFRARAQSFIKENMSNPVDNSVTIKNSNEIAELREKIRTLETRFFDVINKVSTPPKIPSTPEPPQKRYPSVAEIIKIVCKYYRCNNNDLISQRRDSEVMRPRQVIMYLCKTLTLRSYPEIGRYLGNRDHTTIMSGHRKIKKLLISDFVLLQEIETLTSMISKIAKINQKP